MFIYRFSGSNHQFMNIMKQTIPNRLLPSRRNLPWLNRSITRSIKKRNLLFKQAEKNGNFHRYRIARNRTVAMIRLAKKKYYRRLNPRSPKEFWKAVKYLNKNKQSIPTLVHNGTVAHSNTEKADMLNSYFRSCFNPSHPPLSSNQYLHRCSPECNDISCCEHEIYKFLTKLDQSKASGQDGISANMLKNTAASIAPSITKLFNESLKTGIIPSQWKKSLIVPIPKNSNTSSPSNYRPISLLPIISKILERHVYSIILEHLQMNHPLSAYQWGFLESRSTVTALLYCTNEWFKALEDGKEVCAVFFDLKKAFDSVPHAPLLSKLNAIGLDKHITKWLHNYLANRTQAVVINGSMSCTAPVLSGVPQGSVLGPLLFLIYIDDISSIIEALSSKVNLFADDILLYHLITNTHDYVVLQEAITLLDQWSTTNHLTFSQPKCKYMVVSRKHTPTLPPIPLYLHNGPLERVESYKYLGLLLTDNLCWSSHIANVYSKAMKVLGLLYRRFYGYTDSESLKQLYLTLVRPHLDYACQVWDPHLAKDKAKLEKVQKLACRMAARRWDAGYQDLLEIFELSSLEERRLDLKLGLLFKILHEFCYFPETESFTTLRNYCSSRSTHCLQLTVPFAHTNSYKYSFFPHTIQQWNSLDTSCVFANSYTSFMHSLS